MKITGIINNIIFQNSENGWTVANLIVDDEKVSIVGILPLIKNGENVELDGDYVDNPTYGKQFSIKSCKVLPLTNAESISRYLSSGLIKGIGEITANAIVKKFGKDTLDIIEMCPERLAEISGISVNKALNIASQYLQNKKMQSTLMFLQEYDITTKTAVKIYDMYGSETIDILKNNPYKLVEDIEGIGFLTADKIAIKLGLPQDSKFRFRAGVIHILKSASEQSGHTYLLKSEITEELQELLKIDFLDYEETINEVLWKLQIDSILHAETIDNQECLMLTKFYKIESNIAKRLIVMKESTRPFVQNIDSDIAEFERVKKIELHSGQKDAVKMAINEGVCVITGGPGTGKTTIINCILYVFKKMGKRVSLMAPTGRASKRMSEACNRTAKTIHRTLELDFHSKGNFKYNEFNKLPTDVAIVDEVSMVDVMLLNTLIRALDKKTQLILVGDKDQLPSVGAGNALSDILNSKKIPSIMLTEIYRQAKESLIVTNAHAINHGQMPKIDNKSKDFFFQQQIDLNSMLQTIIDLQTVRLPKFTNLEPMKIQVLAPMKNGICGIDNLNKHLQDKINPYKGPQFELHTERLTFRINDKVMQTVNNYETMWKRMLPEGGEEDGVGVFNGDIGYVDAINLHSKEITILFEDGRRAVYPQSEFYSLTLAYAITIHKSQGSEFDCVIIPVISGASKILTRNLLYTAVTRAKKTVVLVGDVRNLHRMVRNEYTTKRYSSLLKFLIEYDTNDFKDIFDV